MRTIIHNVIIDGQKNFIINPHSQSHTMIYPKKTRFESVPTAVLGLYNILLENLVFLNLSVPHGKIR